MLKKYNKNTTATCVAKKLKAKPDMHFGQIQGSFDKMSYKTASFCKKLYFEHVRKFFS